jgi:hypothetical protein
MGLNQCSPYCLQQLQPLERELTLPQLADPRNLISREIRNCEAATKAAATKNAAADVDDKEIGDRPSGMRLEDGKQASAYRFLQNIYAKGYDTSFIQRYLSILSQCRRRAAGATPAAYSFRPQVMQETH